MSARDELKRWLDQPDLAPALKAEILANQDNADWVLSHFGSVMAFGTAGLRGIMGPGTNNMNVYTVAQATQGLANVILAVGKDAAARGVAIAYDSRHQSAEFSQLAASILAANGIKVFLFDELRPTPELSFAIRELGCIAGVNITASHNPKEYNGYKAYWENGAQLNSEYAGAVMAEIEKIDLFAGAKKMPLEKARNEGLLSDLGGEMDERYLNRILAERLNPEKVAGMKAGLRIVYSAFHGTGYKMIPALFSRMGVSDVHYVKEQMIPNGDFPTVTSPNPEDPAGFDLAKILAAEVDADIILGTDPDGDRIGVAVKMAEGRYENLTGNQIGLLLIDYVIRSRRQNGTMPENPFIVKSLVTTELAQTICDQNGIELTNSYVGFRFISERIREYEEKGGHYIFGFEESVGYLPGTYARDKDAIAACMLVTEMASMYKAQGMSLAAALDNLYARYGWSQESTITFTIASPQPLLDMKKVMSALRANLPAQVGTVAVARVRDYQDDTIVDLASGEKKTYGKGQGPSNILYFEMADGSVVVVRPSGTEPKIKLYIMVKGADQAACGAKVKGFQENFVALLDGLLAK